LTIGQVGRTVEADRARPEGTMVVERQVELRFSAAEPDIPHEDLSAVYRDGPWLWLAGDELPRLERLTLDRPDNGRYDDHRWFALGELVDLPEGPDEEVDVEGLDRQGPYLWVVGSHSRSRKRVDPDDPDDKAVRNLAKVREHPNRHVLLRLPIADEGGDAVPARTTTTGTGEVLTAAMLDDGPNGGLTGALAADEHLSAFLSIPGKDNGFDVEGVVAFGERILLGLRGPVLRGWSVVLELEPTPAPEDPTRLTLASDGPAYRKHFLDLDGLGVRDLCRHGDDVLVLAGPTMELDGPVRVYRWHEVARTRDAAVVRGPEISRLVELPYGEGEDHAEGITLVSAEGAPTRLLVVYDGPAAARLAGAGIVLADIVSVPG
jgi:hypothetical protein